MLFWTARKRREPSQIASRTILDRGIDAMVMQRDAHIAEMNRLEKAFNNAQTAYNQHSRLYDALNSALFAINHPFDDAARVDINEALDVLVDNIDAELSVDHPTEGEELDDDPSLPSLAELTDSERVPVIPLRGGKKARKEAAE